MKLYLLVAIVVCQSCHHLSHAEYDSLVEYVERGPPPAGRAGWLNLNPGPEGGDSSLEGGELADWSPYAPWAAVKRSAKADIQTRRRSALDKNFMRFGRSDGKTAAVVRSLRASNLMRFGRPDRNFLRFGRDSVPAGGDPSSAEDAPELSKEYATSTEQLEQLDAAEGALAGGRAASKRNVAGGASEEMMSVGLSESGEQIKPKQIVYYRRDSPKNLMRFGKRRTGPSGYMRFGRANLMRFGRRSDEPGPPPPMGADDGGAPFGRTVRAGGPANLMRFGRAGNLMRFGRFDPSLPAPNRAANGTSPPPANPDPEEDAGNPTHGKPTLPADLLQLLGRTDRLAQGITKEQARLLMAMIAAGEGGGGGGGVGAHTLPDEPLPVYVVEK